jgi:hypothetical protein
VIGVEGVDVEFPADVGGAVGAEFALVFYEHADGFVANSRLNLRSGSELGHQSPGERRSWRKAAKIDIMSTEPSMPW